MMRPEVEGWPGHRAGQHVDVRLTADDGYQAQRSDSIASAPEHGDLELTVERIDDGEVSPYLVQEARPGDQLELRGPIGGHFTWSVEEGGPLLLLARGSGLVPLMAMLRHRATRASDVPAHLLVSVRDDHGAGVVLRCPSCDDVAVRVAVQGDGLAVEWRGTYRISPDAAGRR